MSAPHSAHDRFELPHITLSIAYQVPERRGKKTAAGSSQPPMLLFDFSFSLHLHHFPDRLAVEFEVILIK